MAHLILGSQNKWAMAHGRPGRAFFLELSHQLARPARITRLRLFTSKFRGLLWTGGPLELLAQPVWWRLWTLWRVPFSFTRSERAPLQRDRAWSSRWSSGAGQKRRQRWCSSGFSRVKRLGICWLQFSIGMCRGWWAPLSTAWDESSKIYSVCR